MVARFSTSKEEIKTGALVLVCLAGLSGIACAPLYGGGSHRGCLHFEPGGHVTIFAKLLFLLLLLSL
ncbi:hypothetical protein BX661DRAFT_175300 [Kickxella alabastrina]|uniref:uncharacterized protein n=1 Tax=Kickxella alabastrina TaxID=61397 RepID=UPI00221FA3C9|nr:uncharacterized protein BX661DRAFT_175300 [Kickxella alabastrina]KAI7834674.1 hypothetical protein BX661DRAFT_175300 [Kickxella alabastrina]